MLKIKGGLRMERLVVAKFGGSSLADADQFRKVKAIVEGDRDRKYIVPSAPGKRSSNDYKITDLLYLCHAHVEQGIAFEDVFAVISKRYKELVDGLGLNLDIQKYLDEVKTNVENGASADYTASRGEYLNGIILADYLGVEFIDAAQVIQFDESGVYDEEKSEELVRQKLKDVDRAVIPGFYGAKPDGEIKTFSRGGSDVTGSIVAGSLKASLYENWTDVSGFLMADPRIVKDPKPIERLTYRELRELSYMGATVLHEEAIFPVRKVGIPINIKNTNRPQDKGTFIVSDVQCHDSKAVGGTITGLAGKKNFTVIAVEKTLMNSEKGFCRKLLSILEHYDIPFENMPSGIDTVSLVIADSYLKDKLNRVIKEIKKQCEPDSIDVYPNMALIATVGLGMASSKGMASRVFKALTERNINIRMINQGSSEINITTGIETEDFEKAIQAIYQEFTK
jgi:aspartate kinase